MGFETHKVNEFLDLLASDAPAPGGGSVAALGGALGAALISMVANLTVGKEKYRDSWAEMERVRERSEALRGVFVRLMDEDTAAFNNYMAALKMARDTDEQKALRKAALAGAAMTATDVPLRTLEKCAELANLSIKAVRMGNANAVSDGGSAALLAEAAGKAAAYNIRINLPGISDEAFEADCRTRMANALGVLLGTAKDLELEMDKILG